MSWNYRVVRQFDEIPRNETDGGILIVGGENFGVYEVYYDKEGRPESLTMDPSYLCADSEEELKADYLLMAEAFSKPVLTFRNGRFEGETPIGECSAGVDELKKRIEWARGELSKEDGL